MIRTQKKHHLAYFSLPSKRNQDTIRIITRGYYQIEYAVSVVDGWSNPSILSGDKRGKDAAEFVARLFPKLFLTQQTKDVDIRAKHAAEKMDTLFLEKFPAHVSSVGTFVFHSLSEDIVVSVGDVLALEWNGSYWKKIPGISQHSLNAYKHPSDSSRFFGRGELKHDPLYSSMPDIAVLPPDRTVLVATDGLSKHMTITQFNHLTRKIQAISSEMFLTRLYNYFARMEKRADDISVFIKGKMY